MNADTYAQALYALLKDASKAQASGYIDNLRGLLKKRGHEQLYPKIVARLEAFVTQEHDTASRISVAKESDIAEFKDEILNTAREMGLQGQTLTPSIDDTLVGGFRIESTDKLYDASYKRALLDMYRKLTV